MTAVAANGGIFNNRYIIVNFGGSNYRPLPTLLEPVEGVVDGQDAKVVKLDGDMTGLSQIVLEIPDHEKRSQ